MITERDDSPLMFARADEALIDELESRDYAVESLDVLDKLYDLFYVDEPAAVAQTRIWLRKKTRGY